MNSLPDFKSNVGKRGQRVDPDGTVTMHEIVDEIVRPQSKEPSKMICLQKIRFDNGEIQYRLCYYIIGKKPGRKGKWVFGQFATFLPEVDLRAILAEARARNWL